MHIVYNMHNVAKSPRLVRTRARDQVRDLLRAMIVAREIDDDTPLEEVELAARIGVSRTPLREALIALEEEGLVRSEPNKGFALVPANTQLVAETYPILAALEGAAVERGGAAIIALAPKLREINTRLQRERNRPQQYALDRAFHYSLTHACENIRLLHLLDAHWSQARRFDGAQDRGTADRDGSCREHSKIVDAIEAKNLNSAARLLREHWRRGEGVVIAWLEQRK